MRLEASAKNSSEKAITREVKAAEARSTFIVRIFWIQSDGSQYYQYTESRRCYLSTRREYHHLEVAQMAAQVLVTDSAYPFQRSKAMLASSRFTQYEAKAIINVVHENLLLG